MKNTSNYVIDFENARIIANKKYLKEARSDIHSEAYQTLKELRTDFPTFQIVEKEIKRKEGKQTYGKLTYDMMRQQIELRETKENAPTVLDEFENIIKLSKVHAGAYAFVKAWFLARYKDVIVAEANFNASEDGNNVIALAQ